MANHRESGPVSTGSSRIKMPLMTSPRATETTSAARAVRPLILAHHGHIHHAVNAGDQCAAKGSGQVFEIQRLDPAVEKIHTRSRSFSKIRKKAGQGQASQPVPYPAAVSLNGSPSEQSSGMAAYAPRNVKGQFLMGRQPVCTSLRLLNSTDWQFSGILPSINSKGGIAFIWILTAVTIRVII